MRRLLAMAWAAWLAAAWLGAQPENPQTPVLDVQHYELDVELIPERSFLRGRAVVRARVREDTLGLPFTLHTRLSMIEVLGEEDVRYSTRFDDYDSERLRVLGTESFKKGAELTLRFRFEGTLEREQYAFLDALETQRAMIYPTGALLLSEGKWFPAHGLGLDAATAQVSVNVPLGFTAVAPGTLQGVETAGVTETFLWKSEYPLTQIPVLVGRYLRQQFREGEVPLTFFVTEAFDRDLKPVADEIHKMIAFFKAEYGEFPFSALNFVQAGNVELPSTGCAGLVLLDATVLEPKNPPLLELARRVARQWWGYSARFQAAHDAWLQEGFATYAALRFLEKTHPELYQSELAREAVHALKYEKKAPIIKGLELNPGSAEYSSIVASKGAWILYMLGQLVGKEPFDRILIDWYRQAAGKSVTTGEFVRFVQEKTGEDYRWFFVQWVESVGIPEFRVDYTIYKLRQGGFKIRGQIAQTLDLFRMPVDILIETKGEKEEKRLMVSGKSTTFSFQTETLPLRLNVDPNGKILLDSEARQVQVQIALGDEFRQRAEYADAIHAYDRAKGLNARSSLAHFRLGEVFFEQHNYSSAANSFRDALNGDLTPEWVETWTHIYLGKIYDVLGERQRAMAEYQKAINSKIDYNGAQAEAEKYTKEPYTKPKSVIGS